MKRIAIMTDTNSGMTPEDALKHGVFLIKMPFVVNGTQYLEYTDLSYGDFFKLLADDAEVSTSQPSPGDLIEMWDEILKSYQYIIYFPMSSGLSSTYQTSNALSREYDGRVFVVDNKRVSVTLYEAVLDAVQMAKTDKSPQEIADFFENDGLNASIYVSVNTLKYLKKSGRVTAAGAAIGTLLGIKPVLKILGGKLDAFKKVRGMKDAVDAMLDGIENDKNTRFMDEKVKIRAAYSGDIKIGKAWQHEVQKRFKGYDIELDALPISISCHTGPNALGIGIIPTRR